MSLPECQQVIVDGKSQQVIVDGKSSEELSKEYDAFLKNLKRNYREIYHQDIEMGFFTRPRRTIGQTLKEVLGFKPKVSSSPRSIS